MNRKRLMLAVASSIAMMASVSAQSAETLDLDIKSQSADLALLELAKRSGVQILISSKQGKDITLPAVSGNLTLTEALEHLLLDSGLTYQFTTDNSVVISSGSDEETEAEEPKDVDEEIVVTGSRLTTDPSKLTRQTTIFDREEIERSGATRLDEFLRRLPQNVNAPTNIGSGFDDLTRDFGLGVNAFSGSGVNLRGLGSQYTLILIDGRRPPKGGQFGGITDISNIPIARVERIEVLYDGAAGIYGADAVGGVVNIITRKDYEGTEVSLTYADTTQGGGERINFNVGRTFSWGSGSLTTSLSYQGQEAIDGSQRPELTFGRPGRDDRFDIVPSTPGNVGGPSDIFSPERGPIMWVMDVNGDGDTLDAELDERLSGGSRVDIINRRGQMETVIVDRENPQLPRGATAVSPLPPPIPAGYTPVRQLQLPEYAGQALSLYDVDTSGQLGGNGFVPFLGRALMPEDETYGVSLALNQELTEDLQLSLSLDYSTTDKVSDSFGNSDSFTVSEESLSNPFLRDLDYAFVTGFPQQQQIVDQKSIRLSGDLDWTLNDDWDIRLGFSVGDDKNNTDTLNQLVGFGSRLNASDQVNGYQDVFENGGIVRRQLGTHFHDPLLGFANQEEFIDTLVDPLLQAYNYSNSRDVDLSFEGNLFDTAAGTSRVVFALGHQRQTHEIASNILAFGTNVLDGDGDLESGTTEQNFVETYGTTTNSVAGEISIPLIGENNALPLMEDLLFSASARYEDYANVEDKGFNWTAGFNWTLNDWMVVRLNRNYSLRVPEAVRSARGERYSVRDRLRVLDEETLRQVLVSSLDFPDEMSSLWTINGGSDHLEPERNYGTQLGFIFRPTFAESLDIQLNITESETVDQIGSTLSANSLSLNSLMAENIALNPFLAIADPENVPIHARLEELQPDGSIRRARPGELIRDARAFNVGSTFNRGADLNVRYNIDSEVGSFLITWRHQYTDVNDVTQSDACAQNACLSRSIWLEDRQYDIPLNTVGSVDRLSFTQEVVPLPRSTGSLDVFWEYRGFGVNLATIYEQETTIRFQQANPFLQLPFDDPNQQINIWDETTKREQSVDMVLSYDFSGGLFDVPDWLSSTRISLSLDDVWRRGRSVSREDVQREWEIPPQFAQFFGEQSVEINRYGFEPRGRAFSLRISSTF